MAISLVGTPINQNITLGNWNGSYFKSDIQVKTTALVSTIIVILTGSATPDIGVFWNNVSLYNRISQGDGNLGTISIYEISLPTIGTYNISVRDTHTYTYNISILLLSGVSSATILSSFTSGSSFSSTASGSVNTTPGQFVLGVASTVATCTSDVAQTSIFSNKLADGEYASVDYKIATTTSTSLTWTLSNNRWAIAIIAYNSAKLESRLDFLNSRVKDTQYIIKTGTSSTSKQRIHWTPGVLPPAGTVNTTTIGGVVCNNSTVGALGYTNAATNNDKKIFNISINGDIPSFYFLIDRLWECSVTTSGTVFSITSTSPQTVNSTSWPSRDDYGGIDGYGVYIAVVSNGSWASGSVDFSINYTNSDGISGRTGNSLGTLSGNPTNGTIEYFSLQSGDTGVQSVQSLTLSLGSPAPSSGTFHLIAFRPINIYIQAQIANTFNGDFMSHPLPKLYDGSCLTFITQPRGTTQYSNPFTGTIEYVEM